MVDYDDTPSAGKTPIVREPIGVYPSSHSMRLDTERILSLADHHDDGFLQE